MLDNKYILSNRQKEFFDRVIESESVQNVTGIHNLGGLLFNKLPKRNENFDIIISHVKEKLIHLSLLELRCIVGKLYTRFLKLGIKKGDTIYLASLESNSEVYIAILFLALSSYGVRVLLPMYLEKELVKKWHCKFSFNYIIIPGVEILELDHHDRQKENISQLEHFSKKKNIPCLDIFTDFHLHELVNDPPKKNNQQDEKLIYNSLHYVKETDEALMITTSGTSGISKVVVYDHLSFLINISAWEKAGLYHPDKIGGRGFTPLFTHTMGVRSFINALWTGNSVILINTEWFTERPEDVRYFLKQTQPEHITGGVALFNMLLEMSRVYPDLKIDLRSCLKTLVSSGTAINAEIIRNLKKAFNVQLHNAFGTTETQQVLNTFIKTETSIIDTKSLGSVLPGVSIGLKEYPSLRNTYKLYIKSKFCGKKIIDEHGSKKLKNHYVYLGDLVKCKGDRLYYFKREQPDYINDEFGVKVPLNIVRDNYKRLFESYSHIELIPLKFKPGLGALVFNNTSSEFQEQKNEKNIRDEIQNIIETANNQLYNSLEPLEFNHWTINRFSYVQAIDTYNRKGIISNYKIKRNHAELIKNLSEDNRPKSNIIEIKSSVDKKSEYEKYHNPYVGKLLECLDMDISYVAAEGDFLIHNTTNEKNHILDLTGGYGTNLIGHHNERLTTHAVDFLKSNKIPLSDQLSIQKYPAMLAEKLNEIIEQYTGKSYFTLFGSTGSEIVEISLHHAYLEWMNRIYKLEQDQKLRFSFKHGTEFKKIWGKNWRKIKNIRPVIIANKNAYHGSSSGARSVLGDEERRNKFSGILSLKTVFIDDEDVDIKNQIEKAIQSNGTVINILNYNEDITEIIHYNLSSIIGAIVEPILGEGGIREVNEDFPKLLSSYDFPLIIDEIQSGLGRSGSFLASQNYIGNYYLFSKALGANIAKISAISIEKERFIKKIGKLCISTFSGGAFAANIALENLKLIERENIPEKARKAGNKIIAKLLSIQNKFPNIIESIRGRGLMIGIKFSKTGLNKNLFLRVLSEKKIVGYLFSSYLLRKHNLRILPSISASHILRIEPSVYISNDSIDLLYKGINTLTRLIENDNFYEIVKHLMHEDPYIDNKGKTPEEGFLYTKIDTPIKEVSKVAFIAHFAYPVEEFKMISGDLIQASETGIRQLFSKFMIMMDMQPFILNSRNLYGGKIHLTTILLPLDSSELEKLHKTGKRDKVIKNIQKGVDLAARKGCKYISLGGYTSIISKNGEKILSPDNVKVMTGNTLTAVIGYHKFISKVKDLFPGKRSISLGIVGAHGNIGKILALKMITDSSVSCQNLWLLGNDKTKLATFKNQIYKKYGVKNKNVYTSINLNNLRKCDAIIVAVNTNDPIIYQEHIRKNGPVLISDVSIPTALSENLSDCSHLHILPFGASIKLSDDPDFVATSCSPKGTALCCMAEALLYALEPMDVELRGNITLEGFNGVYDKAMRYGYIEDTDILRSYKTDL